MDIAIKLLETASTGGKLSTRIYTFATNTLHIDKGLTDIAGDVALTSTALGNVGDHLHSRHGPSRASDSAYKDAQTVLSRCQGSFKEVQGLIEGKHRGLLGSLRGMKLELLKKRLESLKSSLNLLLSVLKFNRETSEQ
jgi:hypothetical protein